MKRILFTLSLVLFFCIANAQDYLQIVTLEGINGLNGTFTTAGASANKKEVETNAVKSLFHTLLFLGVDGTNDGAKLVCKENPVYTNSFFNSSAITLNVISCPM